uniref:Dehydrogenase/reductase SDR family member 11 n=1 Tax=Timema poppense TaxID=170557 RepID=A0A7R9DKQ7_TIMPO|nr:unnamed protein product [Timema poppensis]
MTLEYRSHYYAGHVMTSFDDLQMYHVSKYAVTALTEVYRRELKSRSVPIRVSQISPGLVRTEFVRNLYKEHPQKEEKVARYFPHIKLLTSEDIAQTVLYCLASPPHMQVHDIIMRPRGQLI